MLVYLLTLLSITGNTHSYRGKVSKEVLAGREGLVSRETIRGLGRCGLITEVILEVGGNSGGKA